MGQKSQVFMDYNSMELVSDVTSTTKQNGTLCSCISGHCTYNKAACLGWPLSFDKVLTCKNTQVNTWLCFLCFRK